jgi:hypothetical protein
MNNTTSKKKLELKKTAIANLTLNEAQLKMVIGGGPESQNNCDTSLGLSRLEDGEVCGTAPTRKICRPATTK